jgi:hypothetical protein
MKIQIIKILSGLPSLIEFQSIYGIGRAIWAEGIPQQSAYYIVEYTLLETFRWEQTIIANDGGNMTIGYQEGTLILCGELEHVDEDNIGWFRVGESLMLIEIEASKKYNSTPRFVKILSKQAILHDTHI